MSQQATERPPLAEFDRTFHGFNSLDGGKADKLVTNNLSVMSQETTERPPLVEFDRTFHDLYSLDGGKPDELAIMLSLVPPIQPVSAALPENKKYTWQSPGRPNLDKDMFARIFLGVAAQNHGLMAGPMRLIFFDIDPPAYDVENNLVESPPRDHTDANRSLDVVTPAQRPTVTFVSDATRFEAPPGTTIAPYPPQDFLDKHVCLMDQEAHYRLLSKRELAVSGLPTPPTQIIDCELSPAEVADDAKVAAETERFLQAIRSRSFPFVIKFPLAVAGQGVFVVRDAAQLAAAENLGRFAEEIPRMIRSLREDNVALKPASLLLQDIIEGGTTYNQAFFVTKAGRAVFLSCCGQFLDENGVYRTSIIDYERQSEYEAQFRDIIDRAAAFVHASGFYGPMGIDVMTDAAGGQYIVDMNTRIPGDIFMGPLTGHFYKRRGLRYGYMIAIMVLLGDRDRFEKRFWPEIMDGSLLITGWSRGRGGMFGKYEYSAASIAVGGKDMESMLKLVDRVMALAYDCPQ